MAVARGEKVFLKNGPMWHSGRQGGAHEASLPVFCSLTPNFNVVDSGIWQLQKEHVFEIEKVIIEIGGMGDESAQEVVWIHPCALRFIFVSN